MSFGFSISDAALLTQLAWRTVQRSRQACGEYDELTREVTSLHLILKRLETERKRPESPLNRPSDTCDGELGTIVNGCKKTLGVLDKILDKYNALCDQERSTRKLWQQIKFGNGQIASLADQRNMLTYYTSALSLYLNMISVGAVGRVEQQMEDAGGELREIRLAVNSITAHFLTKANCEGSVLTAYADDDKAVWKEFRRELIRDGFSSHHLRKHKTLIQAYLQELGDRGLLDELVTDGCDTGINCESRTEQAHTSSPELKNVSTSQMKDTAPNDTAFSSRTFVEQSIEPAQASVYPLTIRTTSASRHHSRPQKASSAVGSQQDFRVLKGVETFVDRKPELSKPDNGEVRQPTILKIVDPSKITIPQSPPRRHSVARNRSRHHVEGLNSRLTGVDPKASSGLVSTESLPANRRAELSNDKNASEGNLKAAHDGEPSTCPNYVWVTEPRSTRSGQAHDWEPSKGPNYIWVTEPRSKNSGNSHHEDPTSELSTDEGVTEDEFDGSGSLCVPAGMEGVSRISESSPDSRVQNLAALNRARFSSEMSPEQHAHASAFTVRKVRGGRYFVAVKDNEIILAEFRKAMLHLSYLTRCSPECLHGISSRSYYDRPRPRQSTCLLLDNELGAFCERVITAVKLHKEGLDLVRRLKKSMDHSIWWSFSMGQDFVFDTYHEVEIISHNLLQTHRLIFNRAAFYLPHCSASNLLVKSICNWISKNQLWDDEPDARCTRTRTDSNKMKLASQEKIPDEHIIISKCARCKTANIPKRKMIPNAKPCKDCESLNRAREETCDIEFYVSRIHYHPRQLQRRALRVLLSRMEILLEFPDFGLDLPSHNLKDDIGRLLKKSGGVPDSWSDVSISREIIEYDLKLSRHGFLG